MYVYNIIILQPAALTIGGKAQLPTEDIGIIKGPALITNGPPFFSNADLWATLSVIGAILQSDVTLDT